MMITCLIIGKDRCITTVKVDSKKSNFTHNKGLYTIPKESVNLTEFPDGKTESYPELIFIEGEALPINNSSGDMSSFLEETVISNALKQTGKPANDWMGIFKDYFRTPSKLIMAVFAFIILVSFIVGLLA